MPQLPPSHGCKWGRTHTSEVRLAGAGDRPSAISGAGATTLALLAGLVSLNRRWAFATAPDADQAVFWPVSVGGSHLTRAVLSDAYLELESLNTIGVEICGAPAGAPPSAAHPMLEVVGDCRFTVRPADRCIVDGVLTGLLGLHNGYLGTPVVWERALPLIWADLQSARLIRLQSIPGLRRLVVSAYEHGPNPQKGWQWHSRRGFDIRDNHPFLWEPIPAPPHGAT